MELFFTKYMKKISNEWIDKPIKRQCKEHFSVKSILHLFHRKIYGQKEKGDRYGEIWEEREE